MNSTRNYVKNTYGTTQNYLENMSSSRKILLVVITAVLLFAVFYWAFHSNKNRLANAKYQRLITPYALIDNTGETISENVYGSPNGGDISFSFWLKVKNFTPESNSNQLVINQLFSLNNIITVGISRNTNNLQINLLQTSGESNGNSFVELENIPFYTWSHYIITISGRYLTIYTNGQLVKTAILPSVPIYMQNYTIMTNSTKNNSNFVAQLGNLYYFGKILNKNDIAVLVNQVPKIPKQNQ
jgi:hypothetical protein